MKRIDKLGYVTIFFTASYAVFKFMQLPGAAWLMLFAGILIAIYLPLLLLNRLRNKVEGKVNFVYKFGGVLLAMFILSAVFKFNLWGFYIYPPPDGAEVKIFSLPPFALNIAYYLFSIIFIPWLLIVDYRKREIGLFKNIIGGLGLSIISISLIGFQLKAYHFKTLFLIGNVLFILVFLPWHIYSMKDKKEEIHSMFLILIMAYVIILFTYGIFLKWDVSWHEVLMNT